MQNSQQVFYTFIKTDYQTSTSLYCWMKRPVREIDIFLKKKHFLLVPFEYLFDFYI